jgi:hypothetical protein
MDFNQFHGIKIGLKLNKLADLVLILYHEFDAVDAAVSQVIELRHVRSLN